MNVNSYAMAFKHEVCKGRRGSGGRKKSGSGQTYLLALARLVSACVTRSGTRIVGLNKSGSFSVERIEIPIAVVRWSRGPGTHAQDPQMITSFQSPTPQY